MSRFQRFINRFAEDIVVILAALYVAHVVAHVYLHLT